MNAKEARNISNSAKGADTFKQINSLKLEIKTAAQRGYSYVSVSYIAPEIRKILQGDGYHIEDMVDEDQCRSWTQISW